MCVCVCVCEGGGGGSCMGSEDGSKVWIMQGCRNWGVNRELHDGLKPLLRQLQALASCRAPLIELSVSWKLS